MVFVSQAISWQSWASWHMKNTTPRTAVWRHPKSLGRFSLGMRRDQRKWGPACFSGPNHHLLGSSTWCFAFLSRSERTAKTLVSLLPLCDNMAPKAQTRSWCEDKNIKVSVPQCTASFMVSEDSFQLAVFFIYQTNHETAMFGKTFPQGELVQSPHWKCGEN